MSNARLYMIGVCVAVVAALLAAAAQRLLASSDAEPAVITAVLAAKTELPAGHQLRGEDLESTQGALGTGAKAAATDPKALVGRALASRARKGQVIRQDLLAARGSGADIASQLQPGQRALTVMLRDPIAASTLFPGAVVDVLVTTDRGSSGSARESVTRTAIERARVLAITDDVAAARPTATSEGPLNTERRAASPKKAAVTLQVSADQAAELELAASRGTIGLALRSVADTASGAGASATSTGSTSTAPGPDAARAPTTSASTSVPAGVQPTTWEVLVIRGDAVSRERMLDRGVNPRP